MYSQLAHISLPSFTRRWCACISYFSYTYTSSYVDMRFKLTVSSQSYPAYYFLLFLFSYISVLVLWFLLCARSLLILSLLLPFTFSFLSCTAAHGRLVRVACANNASTLMVFYACDLLFRSSGGNSEDTRKQRSNYEKWTRLLSTSNIAHIYGKVKLMCRKNGYSSNQRCTSILLTACVKLAEDIIYSKLMSCVLLTWNCTKLPQLTVILSLSNSYKYYL